MMEKTFWQKIKSSFNPEFSKEVAFQPLKQSFKYLALLLLILSFFLSIRYGIVFVKGIREMIKEIPVFLEKLGEFPEIKIENGKVVPPSEGPFIWKSQNFSFVIDTKGDFNSYLTKEEKEISIILLENKLIFKTPEKAEVRDLSQIKYFDLKLKEKKDEKFLSLALDGKNFELSQEKMNKGFNTFRWVVFPILFIFLFITNFFSKLIYVLILSPISLIVNKVKKIGLRYSNLFNIGIFVLTPVLTFWAIIELIGLEIPYFGFFYNGFYLFFLISGILKTKKEEKSGNI